MQMQKPYSNCLQVDSINTKLSVEMAKMNMSYSRSNCLQLCQQKQTIDKINCYDMRLPRIFDSQPCRNKSAYNRLMNLTFLSSQCSDLCPQECQTVSFDVSVSYFDFPTYLMYKGILMNNEQTLKKFFKTDNITHEMFSNSLAAVNIHFNEIKITEMEEFAAMSFVELVSNVGGTIGLFIEFNLLAFVEFAEVVVEASIISFKRRRARLANEKKQLEKPSKEVSQV